MSTRFQKLAADTKTRITEINLATYKNRASSATPPLLIDVRDAEEFAAGHPVGAIHASRGTLEGKIEEIAPDVNTPIVLSCAGGNRSAFAAESLQRMGYTNVASLIGGYRAWVEAGQPVIR